VKSRRFREAIRTSENWYETTVTVEVRTSGVRKAYPSIGGGRMAKGKKPIVLY
jgi:hypothetical protein